MRPKDKNFVTIQAQRDFKTFLVLYRFNKGPETPGGKTAAPARLRQEDPFAPNRLFSGPKAPSFRRWPLFPADD
jgi:hypothetical protein